MGREVRMVPPTWEHPKDKNGNHHPMYDLSFAEAKREWIDGLLLWEKGEHPDQKLDYYDGSEYWEWDAGNPPDPKYYMPDWPDEERTHYQMYEDTSEGTPISPIFETPEELARWLADTGASSFASMTATYEQWLRVCKGGWAPSAAITTSGLISGVEAMAPKKG